MQWDCVLFVSLQLSKQFNCFWKSTCHKFIIQAFLLLFKFVGLKIWIFVELKLQTAPTKVRLFPRWLPTPLHCTEMFWFRSRNFFYETETFSSKKFQIFQIFSHVFSLFGRIYKEVHESAIFGHCARPSSLVNR